MSPPGNCKFWWTKNKNLGQSSALLACVTELFGFISWCFINLYSYLCFMLTVLLVVTLVNVKLDRNAVSMLRIVVCV